MAILKLDIEGEKVDFLSGYNVSDEAMYLYIIINAANFSGVHFRIGMSKKQFEDLKRIINAVD